MCYSGVSPVALRERVRMERQSWDASDVIELRRVSELAVGSFFRDASLEPAFRLSVVLLLGTDASLALCCRSTIAK